MSDSLVNKTVKNIGYNAIAKVVMYAFQAMANIVLGRCLGASDYGITGFAFIFINFLMNFSDLGIKNAVIQKSEVNEEELSTAFVLKMVFGVVIFIITFLIAGAAPYFFDNVQVVPVIRILALNFIITTFSFLPSILLTRDLDYKKLSIAQSSLTIVSAIVAIAFALGGYKFWSIVIANITANIVSIVIFNIFRPVKLSFTFNRDYAKHFIKFGGSLFLSGIITFAIFNFDNFAIGSIKGAEDLGYYALAFNWGSIICTIIFAIATNVLLPTFSKIRDQKDKIIIFYLKTVEYVSAISILFNVTLFIVSKDFLVLVLGHGTVKWIPALVVLQVFCFYGISRSILEPIGQVIIALGDTSLILRTSVIVAVLEIAFIYPVLVRFGIVGVSILVTVVYTLQYFMYSRYIFDRLGIKLSKYLNIVYPQATSALAAILIIKILFRGLEINYLNFVLKLLFIVLIYSVVYLLMTKKRCLVEIKQLIKLPQ